MRPKGAKTSNVLEMDDNLLKMKLYEISKGLVLFDIFLDIINFIL